MKSEDSAAKQVRRFKPWLRRLAETSHVIEAANALWTIELAMVSDSKSGRNERSTREEEDALALTPYTAAIDALSDDLDRLIPAWVARFVEQLAEAYRQQQRRIAAINARDEELPPIDMANILAVGELQKVVQATGERLDPHVEPIVSALETMDRDRDEHLAATLEYVGPAVAMAAAPKLLNVLQKHSVWCWPSHVARALARSAKSDDSVFATLRKMLSHEDEEKRKAAVSVLGLMGPAARAASDELLAFQNGDEGEQCGMIHSLARQGNPTPAFLDVLDAAMRSDNGYVRCSATYALGDLTPQPERFVPLLIDACGWTEPLHDNDLPEAAVDALGRYGTAAQAALPRLREFVEGPIKGRTVKAESVRRAIESIAVDGLASTETKKTAPYRPSPIPDEEPLFAVSHEGKQCYIDREGRLALVTRFSSGEAFSDARAIVRDEEIGMFVIDRQGREVFRSDWDDIRPYSEGLAAIKRRGKWGFIDIEGRVVVEPTYDAVTSFSEGVAGFEVGRGEEEFCKGVTRTVIGRRGFIDKTGKVAIPAEWTDAYAFRDGRALVCTGGAMKPEPIFDGRMMLSDRKWGFIDHSSNLVIPGRYDFAHSFAEGLCVVQVGDLCRRARYGYIDSAGREVIPLTLTEATSFKDGLAVVKHRGKRRRGLRAIIDRSGHVLAELNYASVNAFSEGLAAAWTGDAFGFIDVTGSMIIQPQFDQCEPFSNGLAAVQRGDWYGLIDRTGKFIWGPTTEDRVVSESVSDWTW